MNSLCRSNAVWVRAFICLANIVGPHSCGIDNCGCANSEWFAISWLNVCSASHTRFVMHNLGNSTLVSNCCSMLYGGTSNGHAQT